MVAGGPRRRTTRSRGRYLAPLALLATVAATVLIVRAGLAVRHDGTRTRGEERVESARRPGGEPAASGGERAAAFYVVRAGDSLSSIAARTGVPVGALEALNPRVDPYALRAGERLRLRR